MKTLVLILISFTFLNLVTAQTTGTFTDSRDGKTYKTVTIGTQVWMAANLAFKPETGVYYDYGKNPEFATYGFLYDRETASKVCPKGWHLPSDEEWKTLITFLGGEEVAGIKLKAKSEWGDEWEEYGIGTDDFGFNALPGGAHLDICNCLNGIYSFGTWWSSTQTDNGPIKYSLSSESQKITRGSSDNKNKFSVRCIKD